MVKVKNNQGSTLRIWDKTGELTYIKPGEIIEFDHVPECLDRVVEEKKEIKTKRKK